MQTDGDMSEHLEEYGEELLTMKDYFDRTLLHHAVMAGLKHTRLTKPLNV